MDTFACDAIDCVTMAVTLKNIAREVGLNASTVSRVLANPGSSAASEATSRRVLDAARRLGYRPNAAARALVSGRSHCIGIFVPELCDPVFGQYVETLCDRLAEHGLVGFPIQVGWELDREVQALELLESRHFDAALSLFYHHEHQALYQRLQEKGLPIVFRAVDEFAENVGMDCVATDIGDAYEALIRHMVERGYRRIAIVGGVVADFLSCGRSESRDGAAFGRGGEPWVRRAHEEMGLSFDPELAIRCGPTAAAAYQAVGQHLDDPAKPAFDGVILQSNRLLPGVQRVLAERGLRVPTDVGLAAVSDAEVSRFGVTPVTVWDQPIEKICRGMVNLVVRRLANPGAPITASTYASRLVVRQSTSGKGIDPQGTE